MFTGTMPVREAHWLDPARLEMYMAEQIEGFEGPLEIAQFRGAQSNPTYLVTAGVGRYPYVRGGKRS